MFKKKMKIGFNSMKLSIVKFTNQISLQTMILPGLLLLLIFRYWPMYGLIIAFKDYSIISPSFAAAPWAGFKHFITFLNDINFYRVLRNSIGINVLGLLISFPLTVIFALLINEIVHTKFKRITQTVSYLPHFLSWVIFVGILKTILALDTGALNNFLINIGLIKEPIFFMGNPDYFWWLAVFTRLLKEIGWGTILYLAAIAGIDQELFEAAIIDGANRFQRMWHITVPGISTTIIILLILTISNILNWGFDQIWMLQNNVNISMSETLETYVYKMGIRDLRFSYAAAVGLLKSVMAMILLISSDQLSKKLTGKGIF